MLLRYYPTVLCFLLIFSATVFFTASCLTEKELQIKDTTEEEAEETLRCDAPLVKQTVLVLDLEEGQDIIIRSYQDPELQEEVLAFFLDITGSAEVAEVILSNATANDIPPALAFSLCAEESRYNPRALNRNRNETVDRGLFQLNSASFPKLTTDDFYDPAVNARHGLSYLRWCLNIGGTEVAALAMYNAGHNRVSNAGTPKSTLDYVSRILNRQRKIEERFMALYATLVLTESVETETIEEEKPPFRLSLLTPLGGR